MKKEREAQGEWLAETEGKDMADKKIQWHPGFAAAVNLELSANREDLIYEREYNLNTKPLAVDLLVIKKDKGVDLENEIGKLFRGHNILEYKSPDDSLNIDTFYKSEAYACLYKAYGEAVDLRQAGDITVTIVRERRPEGLFKYFDTHGIRVKKAYKGIYYVLDSVLFPTQVIVTKELEPGEHIWLKSLSSQLGVQEIRELLEWVEGLAEEGEKRLAEAVLEVSIRANQKAVERLRGDEGMCEALLEIMEPEINRMVKAATEKETRRLREETERLQEENRQEAKRLREEAQKEAMETAAKILKSGKFSVEEVKDFVPRLSMEEIKAIAADLSI